VTDAIVEIQGVEVEYGARTILRIDRLVVRRGETLAIIGPNGSGKSTLLRVLGLLERPARGEIRLDGRPVAWVRNLLSARRRFASVFQEPLLADTTVERNVALGLALRHAPGAEIRRRASEWIARFGITPLAGRQARTLSGGEAQRTSLARAFAIEPDVLLLDEPFSALDPPTREELLRDLQRILRETAVTAVFVTHDRSEALRLGDRVAVMLDGRLAQLDTPEIVFARPAGPDVARFVGVENLVPGRVVSADGGLLAVEAGPLCVMVPGEVPVGRSVLVCIRPEDVVLRPESIEHTRDSALNRFPGHVVELTAVGAQFRIVVECGRPLVAVITRHSVQELSLKVGSAVTASFKASAVHVIERTEAVVNPGSG
jgi:molybdopterin-binding protein